MYEICVLPDGVVAGPEMLKEAGNFEELPEVDMIPNEDVVWPKVPEFDSTEEIPELEVVPTDVLTVLVLGELTGLTELERLNDAEVVTELGTLPVDDMVTEEEVP